MKRTTDAQIGGKIFSFEDSELVIVNSPLNMPIMIVHDSSEETRQILELTYFVRPSSYLNYN